MNLRSKIFTSMGVILILCCTAYVLSTRVYLGGLLDHFKENNLDAGYLSASPSGQIDQLRSYLLGRMRIVGFGIAFFFTAVSLVFCFWILSVLTGPLRKLVEAIERVRQGDLSVNVPVRTKDEYGNVIRTFNGMTQRLRHSEEARKRLVADVAHELRTPLSMMQCKLENFQQEGVDVQPMALLPLHDELIRLSRLVDDLHVLSLAESGGLMLECRTLDLVERLFRIVDIVKDEAEEKGLSIVIGSDAGQVAVTADARRITQVFLNLLTNAIRYTPEGGTISVQIEGRVLRQDAAYVRISVADTGIGIPEEALAHLFDRFYRVEEARSRHTGGAGLGLAIAEQFVKAHGGFIDVESRQGSGTTFRIYLPAEAGA